MLRQCSLLDHRLQRCPNIVPTLNQLYVTGLKGGLEGLRSLLNNIYWKHDTVGA